MPLRHVIAPSIHLSQLSNMSGKAKYKSQSRYVQYGCGMSPAIGWENFDGSPTLLLERTPLIGMLIRKNKQRFPRSVQYGDIVRGLPIPKASCKAIYCSHVLEHLSLSDCRIALRNTCNLLQAGGVFRAVLPDLEAAIKTYIANSTKDAAPLFMRETQLGLENRGKQAKDLVKLFWGNSHHLWMWDYKSLAAELKAAGFAEIRKASFGDAEEKMFRSAEQQDRWANCLGIECKKPA
jgi:predicted SAM-dependent methyltransferase